VRFLDDCLALAIVGEHLAVLLRCDTLHSASPAASLATTFEAKVRRFRGARRPCSLGDGHASTTRRTQPSISSAHVAEPLCHLVALKPWVAPATRTTGRQRRRPSRRCGRRQRTLLRRGSRVPAFGSCEPSPTSRAVPGSLSSNLANSSMRPSPTASVCRINGLSPPRPVSRRSRSEWMLTENPASRRETRMHASCCRPPAGAGGPQASGDALECRLRTQVVHHCRLRLHVLDGTVRTRILRSRTARRGDAMIHRARHLGAAVIALRIGPDVSRRDERP
jgi:hypothetical protein